MNDLLRRVEAVLVRLSRGGYLDSNPPEPDDLSVVLSDVREALASPTVAPADELDTKRLDWLESLRKRAEFQNSRRPNESTSTDIHIHKDRVSIYLRGLTAEVKAHGEGPTVRSAIDAAIDASQSPCGCQLGTCESKRGVVCRMAAEIKDGEQ